jgi:serine/threonine protein phosphatase PrpC
MILRHAAESLPGKRPENQDFFVVDPEFGIYMVCDGMGGHAGGKTASREAATAIHRELERHLAVNDEVNVSLLGSIITGAITAACQRLKLLTDEQPSLKGMGTTATVVVCNQEKAVMGHVGDSRLYLRRNGSLFQLSRDHTFVNELLSQNIITPEQARHSSYAHILTRAIGAAEAVQVDLLQFELLAGDNLILCSDGFYAFFQDSIEKFLQMFPEKDADPLNLESLVKRIVHTSVELDGNDNSTAVFVAVEPEKNKLQAALKRRSDVMLEVDTLRNLYLFQDLAYNDLLKIIDIAQVYDVDIDTPIVTEGTAGDALYLVLRGSFSVMSEGTELATIHSGSHFGEIALITETPRTATVISKEPSRVLKIRRKPLKQLLHKFAHIGVQFYSRIATTLSERLISTNAKMRDLQCT